MLPIPRVWTDNTLGVPVLEVHYQWNECTVIMIFMHGKKTVLLISDEFLQIYTDRVFGRFPPVSGEGLDCQWVHRNNGTSGHFWR